MIRAAIGRGLDGLVFTDHYRLVSKRRVAELCERYAPFRVYGGIEIRISGEDVLALGIDDPELEKRRWAYEELHGFVKQRDGFLVLAHPFRYRDTIQIDVETYPPDAVEVRSINIDAGNEPRIRELAERLGMQLVCNSDAHRAADVGRYYNVLPRAPRDARDLVCFLRNGEATHRPEEAALG